ncbi:MAG: Lrp/AsnC family transcriptional regulator [Syntrophomonadaceae bacterium]|jgi:DNA-binding Lrp family transcriptional regulator|nr:Lrp/AsnC family transcriptional regulator [Syntrophomonadaceae bacterium]MDH7498078.1 Lrp/AsnC family transcriptional regulator [Syntrophomonadaceae bacterium]
MELERKLLKLYEKDATLSPTQVATMLGVSEDAVRQAIARLERDKIILGYNAVINWEKWGEDGVSAMIDVKVTPEREVGFDRIAERISRFPEVRCVYLMSGTYDLSVVVHCEDMKDVARFISDKLAPLEQVQSTVTHFVLKRYKQDNFLFEDKEEDRRLVVSP